MRGFYAGWGGSASDIACVCVCGPDPGAARRPPAAGCRRHSRPGPSGSPPIPKEEFLRDPKIHLLAERCFQLAIQCLLDICYHLAARRGWERPEDGAAAIASLAERGVFPLDFAQSIRPMANFRNILVHADRNIDRELVHANLARLDDFRTFQRHILVALAAP